MRCSLFLAAVALAFLHAPLFAQGTATPTPAAPPPPPPPTSFRAPTALEIRRGEYGRYRANNDLLYYTLDVTGR